MSVSVVGFVKNGVIVPNVPLPEGAAVEIRLQNASPEAGLTPAELRRMPREQRQAILAAAALAEHDYSFDKELTGFEAFSEEEKTPGRCFSSEVCFSDALPRLPWRVDTQSTR